jgi:hypothetical protein
LDPIVTITAQGRKVGFPRGAREGAEDRGKAYWLVWGKDGHAISIYPVVTPVLLMPVYVPAVIYLAWHGWETWRLDWIARIMEKLSASLVAATSVAILYLALRRRTAARPALLLSLVYAFGTTTWMISSQALWQHSMAGLLMAGALLVMTGQASWRAAILAGLLCGLIGCNRPPDSLLAAGMVVGGICWARRRAALLVLSAAVPVVLTLIYNFAVAGHYAGGYGLVGNAAKFFRHSMVEGFAGLLFSPTRGLFVFSPFLVFLPLFAVRLVRQKSDRLLIVSMLIGVSLQIALYSKADWRQGVAYGPRWLTSMLPLLIWMLAPIYVGLRRAGKTLFWGSSIVAIAIQAVGAFWYDGSTDARIFAAEEPNAPKPAWRMDNAPFLAELRDPRPTMDLSTAVQGSLDLATTEAGLDLSAANGQALTIEGWALTNGRQPFQLVAFLDGEAVAETRNFFVRPDVPKAQGTTVATGWRMTIPSRPLSRGEHVLAIFARPEEHAVGFYLGERRFRIPGETHPLAQQAAVAIAHAQQSSGYWLTSFSKGTLYENPRPELNTFLNAMMIDMLDPVAQQAGLSNSMGRARQFLASQIEEGGLVRYHGVPGVAPGLGCTITPDADDTALIWRIAPGANRDLLSSALRTLGEYRTSQGLYRTWLSSPSNYHCIDPGKDSNPADIAIQMHVLMLLAKQDRVAADALCSALRNAIKEDSLWVYYAKTSLIPILRLADLETMGCPLQLPASRLGTTVPDQDIWIAAAKILLALQRGQPAAKAEVSDWLDMVSRDNFALVHRSPPLLYHNDLTATVSRYYWSEDFAYALWLRLYFASARNSRAGQ